ncbi:hypothetical protein [Desulfopila sp. IMCC35008]|uniref:hypothetical protein n=1 Tax=Desulfopila sp. IMCC35008 TaxID=2653858 RepID=UPI0013D02880|nr:hypothetical protein [Desulfopila sp. IMCC35008]
MEKITADRMCFGLSPELDKQSFCCFLQLAGGTEFSETLADRVSTDEIDDFITSFTRLMKKHLSEHEYHTIFLQQKRSHKQEKE